MNLYNILSIAGVMVGIITFYLGIQITMSSTGKFKVVTILFGTAIGIIILKEIIKIAYPILNLDLDPDIIYRISVLVELLIVLSAVIIMKSIISNLQNNHKRQKETGAVKKRTRQPKKTTFIKTALGKYLDLTGKKPRYRN